MLLNEILPHPTDITEVLMAQMQQEEAAGLSSPVDGRQHLAELDELIELAKRNAKYNQPRT